MNDPRKKKKSRGAQTRTPPKLMTRVKGDLLDRRLEMANRYCAKKNRETDHDSLGVKVLGEKCWFKMESGQR